MPSWASQRRLLYIALVAGFFLLILAYPVFNFIYKPPSCSDSIQNQNETGVDCGGSCARVCADEAVAPIVLWSQSLKVRDGIYDAVARIENPNVSAGARDVEYSFKLYDNNGILVAERRGTTFINPNEQFVLFESGIETKERIPSRVFFEFISSPDWVSVSSRPPSLSIRNQTFSPGQTPRLKADIVNNTLDIVSNVIITALVFGDRGNVIAASKTEVDRLNPSSSRPISFIWPEPFSLGPTQIEVVPRVNLVP